MAHVEVSWHPRYSISLDNLDGPTVYHLKQALQKYLKGKSLDDETTAFFNETAEVCGRIESIDDRD
jgi:hypothetical protein